MKMIFGKPILNQDLKIDCCEIF